MELFPPLLSFSCPFRAFDSCLILDYVLVINFIIIIIIIIHLFPFSPFLFPHFICVPSLSRRPSPRSNLGAGCSVSSSSGSWGARRQTVLVHSELKIALPLIT